MAKRELTRVTVFSHERYDGEWMPEGLADAIAWLNDKLESIPAEYRDSATIEIDSVSSWEDSHYASITITYTRPETDDEVCERVDRERRMAAHREAQERATYEALKRKFAPPAAQEKP